MRTLIAGLGNIFAGDDGFGSEVARVLLAAAWPDGVELQDFGIRGIHLAYQLLDGYDLVVVIDAVDRGEPPGTVYEIDHGGADEPAPAGGELPGAMMDAHDLGPDGVLALVPRLGGTLGRVVVIGCQPGNMNPGMGLSPVVASSVGKAAQLVTEIVWHAHTGSRTRVEPAGTVRSGGG